MKNRLATVAWCVFVACGIALAQPYQIRVSQNTNLRASDSLDSVVLASAKAGTTLQVVGHSERWLRVNRDGRSYWMAGWVNHTRVEEQQIAPASEIDNCCLVNRQCAIDEEWVDGYWAYQRNECPVSQPATTGTAPVAPPTGQPIDNCCFVNRQCESEREWMEGYHAFQFDSQCLAEPSAPVSGSVAQFACQTPAFSHPIPIWGPSVFKNRLGCALDLLKRKGGGWYNYTVSALQSIQATSGSGARVYSATGKVLWGSDSSSIRSGDFASLASSMVHEACHVQRHRSGLESGGVEGERACVEVMIKALDALHSNHPRRHSLQRLVDTIRDNSESRWWGKD